MRPRTAERMPRSEITGASHYDITMLWLRAREHGTSGLRDKRLTHLHCLGKDLFCTCADQQYAETPCRP